jgi:hypothetical protein
MKDCQKLQHNTQFFIMISAHHVLTIVSEGITVKSGIFDGFLEVFWIFLKNEHDKPLGTPNRAF